MGKGRRDLTQVVAVVQAAFKAASGFASILVIASAIVAGLSVLAACHPRPGAVRIHLDAGIACYYPERSDAWVRSIQSAYREWRDDDLLAAYLPYVDDGDPRIHFEVGLLFGLEMGEFASREARNLATLRMYKRAALCGYPQAITALALAYERGEHGVAKNEELANCLRGLNRIWPSVSAVRCGIDPDEPDHLANPDWVPEWPTISMPRVASKPDPAHVGSAPSAVAGQPNLSCRYTARPDAWEQKIWGAIFDSRDDDVLAAYRPLIREGDPIALYDLAKLMAEGLGEFPTPRLRNLTVLRYLERSALCGFPGAVLLLADGYGRARLGLAMDRKRARCLLKLARTAPYQSASRCGIELNAAERRFP